MDTTSNTFVWEYIAVVAPIVLMIVVWTLFRR